MPCPLCGGRDINYNPGLKYPYYCLCCETVYNKSDVAAKRLFGVAGYRARVKPVWNKVKDKVLRYQKEKEARFID